MRQGSNYEISTMTGDEVALALAWAGREGWNPGRDDPDSFSAADATGFLLGRLDGVPVATISAVKYGDSFAFIGLYIVDPHHRGRGYGLRIWQHAMAQVQGRNIGLDGVLAQQENYRKSGFALAHRNIRYAGRRGEDRNARPAGITLRTPTWAELVAFDRAFFPERRDRFLAAWLDQPHGHTLAAFEKGEMVGCGTVRACQTGYKIGPLNARDPAFASVLFDALAARVPVASELYLDVPEPNRCAIELAQGRGMQPVFETARMYTGAFPDLPLAQMFGITTFELG